MKKYIIFLLLLVPVICFAQDPITDDPLSIDRAMSVWSRVRVNANFTYIFDEVDGIRAGDSAFTIIVSDSANIRALNADTATITVLKADSTITRVLDYDPPHGAMNFADSATIIALTQNEWTKVTGPAGDLFVIWDQDNLTIAGDSITIAVAGDYMAWVAFSFDGVQNAIFHIAIYKNGIVTDWEMHRKTSAQDTGNAGMPAYLKDLVIGDDISIWIENTGNDGDATMVSGQWVITMLHPD